MMDTFAAKYKKNLFFAFPFNVYGDMFTPRTAVRNKRATTFFDYRWTFAD